MDDLPPSEGEERAPFRAPGLRVDVPRREAALVRIVRAAWAPAREVAGEGARALEALPDVWAEFVAGARRVMAGPATWFLWAALPFLAVSALLATVWRALGLDEVQRKALITLAIASGIVTAMVGVILVAVAWLEGFLSVAGTLLRGLALVGVTVSRAVTAAVAGGGREVGREVGRRVYDVRVRRERSRDRTRGPTS